MVKNIARGPSNYQHLVVQREGTRVDFINPDSKLDVVKFSYYESILSPFISANVVYTDLGYSVKSDKAIDPTERRGTLVNSLPITSSGKEKFEFIIKPKLGELNFKSYPLSIIAAPPAGKQESFRNATMLVLTSEFAVANETTTVYKKYYNNLSNSVKEILEKELKIPLNKLTIEQTKNSCAFPGSGVSPFTLIKSLCPQAVPVEGSAGFLFWETRTGFNFRSIDSLFSAQPYPRKYVYKEISTSSIDEDNDFRIISYSIDKNQNLLTALKNGVYKTKNIFFDPFTFEYKEIYLSLTNSGIVPLGLNVDYSSEFDAKDSFSRIYNYIFDTGNMEVGISTNLNNDPRLHLAQSRMRYNTLTAQVVNMIIPCNAELQAGDVIECEFNKVTPDNKSVGAIDRFQSGKYLIMHLCHDFDPKNSYTSLTLVKDTYG